MNQGVSPAHSPGLPGSPGRLTSKVGAICQLGLLVALGEHADHAVLDEVHLLADGAFADDVVTWLEDLEAQLGQHGGHEVGVCIGEQWHGGHQLPAVKVDDLLLPRGVRERGRR